jgi:hypothetical protein
MNIVAGEIEDLRDETAGIKLATEGVRDETEDIKGEAQGFSDLAEAWATKTDGAVEGTEYSSKYYAQAAESFAQTAVSAPGTSATSSTSLTLGKGSKTLTIQTGKSIVPGMFVTIAATADPVKYMAAQVISYDSGTGELITNALDYDGSGTYSAWTVSLAPAVQAGPEIIREVRTANTILTADDLGKWIDFATHNTITQTLTAAATLGPGWYAYLSATQINTAMSINGTFADSTGWTLGAGWAIGGGTLGSGAGSASEALYPGLVPTVGHRYKINTPVSQSAGNVEVRLGGQVGYLVNGSNEVYITASNTNPLSFNKDAGWVGALDNVTVTDVTAPTITIDHLVDGVTSGIIKPGMTLLVQCDGTGFTCMRLGPQVAMEILTSGTSWTCPLGVRVAKKRQAGGGGGGTTGDSTCGGGGAGGYNEDSIPTVPGRAYKYAIGAAGVAGNGNAAGSTYFYADNVTYITNGGYNGATDSSNEGENGGSASGGGLVLTGQKGGNAGLSHGIGGQSPIGYGSGGEGLTNGVQGAIILEY